MASLNKKAIPRKKISLYEKKQQTQKQLPSLRILRER
jgi:hypothetical protein